MQSDRRLTGAELFQFMDTSNAGLLNLETMRSLYERVPLVYRAIVREVLRQYVFTQQSFDITQEQFVALFELKARAPVVKIFLEEPILTDQQPAPNGNPQENSENIGRLRSEDLKRMFERRKQTPRTESRQSKKRRKSSVLGPTNFSRTFAV